MTARTWGTHLLALMTITGLAQGSVSISLTPEAHVVAPAQTVGVRLELSSPTPTTISAAQVLFSWDPTELRLLGVDNTGAAALLTSGLPSPDPHGLNESALPTDGDALYLGLARLGTPLPVSEEGETVLLTTLLFQTLAPTMDANVDILASAGSPAGRTTVLDGATPNLDVVGALFSASFTVVPAPSASGLCLLALATTARRKRRD